MNVLLAGGTGYIGSHIAVAMIEAGHDVIIADNLSNSTAAVVDRIRQITGIRPALYVCDVSEAKEMRGIFRREKIDAVVHLAGLKAAAASLVQPLEYYRNNLDTTLTLLEVMREYHVKRFVFSSSALVYGEGAPYPYKETMKRGPCTNPYGWTKAMTEQILTDAAAADPELSVVLLRYFNPIGAHESGEIGEDPQGVPDNLMPRIAQAAVGKSGKLTVFGGDYDTPDGTCRRDYLHIMDLADGHVKAADYAAGHTGTEIFNLGTGTPYSVLEIISAFEKSSGVKIPYEIGPRRPGDLPEYWADASKAGAILGWRPSRGLDEMCRDSWNWQKKNPEGFREE